MSLFPPSDQFSMFMIAALAIGAAPGPGMLYVVARSLGQGGLAAFISVLGLSVGSFINCLIAAFGLAALLAISPLAFDVVRFVGATYLAYLAVKIVRADGGFAPVAPGEKIAGWTIFLQAVLTNIMNPKSSMFYLAFMPHFTDPQRGSVLAQFIVLGLIFNIMGNSINMMVGLFFGRIGDWISERPRFWIVQKWTTASILGALALHLAFIMAPSSASTF